MAGLFRQSAQTSFPLGAKTSLKPEDEAEAGISEQGPQEQGLVAGPNLARFKEGNEAGGGGRSLASRPCGEV